MKNLSGFNFFKAEAGVLKAQTKSGVFTISLGWDRVGAALWNACYRAGTGSSGRDYVRVG